MGLLLQGVGLVIEIVCLGWRHKAQQSHGKEANHNSTDAVTQLTDAGHATPKPGGFHGSNSPA